MMIRGARKAELSPITIIFGIIIIGLLVFFGLKALGVIKKTQKGGVNVTRINESVTSTAPISGGINITNGTNLVLSNPIQSVKDSQNKTKTLIKVIYPNHTLTPGDAATVNITAICAKDYAPGNISSDMADWIYIKYLLSPVQPAGSFEIDYLIPQSLGGSTDEKNLWPQPKDPRPGYIEKNVLENYYHKQVCAGKMGISSAQTIMATNWFQGYLDAKESGGI